MAEPKPIASLSAGLLARKGAASPAMRRQPIGHHAPRVAQPGANTHSPLDDCGWNDMGYDVDPAPGAARAALDLRPLLTPASGPHEPVAEQAPPVPEVVRQQEALQEALREAIARPDPPVVAPPVAAVAPALPTADAVAAPLRRKAAFTLRLDGERHLRLRLASAVSHRSAQQILTELLDAYLSRPDVVAAIAVGSAASAYPSGEDRS